jgi:hypothetical protein
MRVTAPRVPVAPVAKGQVAPVPRVTAATVLSVTVVSEAMPILKSMR